MYTVTFMDGTTFQGGDPANSLWDKIPVLPIKSIEYTFGPLLKYSFEDFEEYAHCVERIRGLNSSIELISKVIIMGRVKNRVYQVVVDKDGGVYQMVVPYGQEYSPQSKIIDGKFAGWLNGKPLSGWIQGIPGGAPKLRKIDIN